MEGLPSTAASRPRLVLSSTDSCGLSMGSSVSVAVCTGLAGLDMSSTATPPETPVEPHGVGREQQRGVVVRALVAGAVHVAVDLEAPGGALSPEEARVAAQPVVRAVRGHAALDARLPGAARYAVRAWRGHEGRLRVGLHGGGGGPLAVALAQREQVVQLRQLACRAQRRQRDEHHQQYEGQGPCQSPPHAAMLHPSRPAALHADGLRRPLAKVALTIQVACFPPRIHLL